MRDHSCVTADEQQSGTPREALFGAVTTGRVTGEVGRLGQRDRRYVGVNPDGSGI